MPGGTSDPSDPRFACVGNPVVREQVVVMRLPLHEMAVELAEPNEAAPIPHAPDQYATPVTLPGQPAHLPAFILVNASAKSNEAGGAASGIRNK